MTVFSYILINATQRDAREYYLLTETEAEDIRTHLSVNQRLDRLYGPEQPEIETLQGRLDALGHLRQALLSFMDALQYCVHPCYSYGCDLKDPAQEEVERTFVCLNRIDPEVAALFKTSYDAWMEQARADWRVYDLHIMAQNGQA